MDVQTEFLFEVPQCPESKCHYCLNRATIAVNDNGHTRYFCDERCEQLFFYKETLEEE